MKQILIALVFLFVGIVIGKLSFSRTTIVSNVQDLVYKKVKSTDCKSDLKQANLLYGKVFTTFLATIGIKLEHKKELELKAILKDPENYLKENKEDHVGKSPKENAKSASKPEQNLSPLVKETPRPYDYEQISKAGKNILLKEPNLYYIGSRYIEKFDESVSKLNGSYTGKLYKTDKDEYNNTADDISLEIRFTETEKGNIGGSFYLELSTNGHPYSTSNGTGGNNNLRVNPKRPDIVLMKAAPDTFFQFNVNNPTVLNYYKDGKHAGYARLNKN